MTRLLLLVALHSVGALPASAQEAEKAEEATPPSAEELLDRVDANLTYESRSSRLKMTVDNPKRSRTYEMRTWGRGTDEAAIEYLAPARDKGTRMLRKGDELWMYLPAVERVQKISGHMLRQGLSGSDMSYEDLLGATRWRDQYEAEVVGGEELDGTPVWRVELTARDDSISYPKRIAWVNRDTRIPVKQELYALSGMKLKTWEMSAPRTFGEGRVFPTKMVVTDHLKEGTKTTLELTELAFGVELDSEVFGMRWLERR